MKRRDFIQRSAAFSAPLILPASVLGKDGHTAPSERVTVALIGCGGQGNGVFNGMLNNKEVQGVAVCDPVCVPVQKHFKIPKTSKNIASKSHQIQ